MLLAEGFPLPSKVDVVEFVIVVVLVFLDSMFFSRFAIYFCSVNNKKQDEQCREESAMMCAFYCVASVWQPNVSQRHALRSRWHVRAYSYLTR